MNDINSDPTLLPGYTLKPIVISNLESDDTEIVQQFVKLSSHHLYLSDTIIGVTGILSPKAISILTPLARRERVILSVIIHTDQLDNLHSGGLLSLISLSAIVSVLLSFMAWQRIGVITDSTDIYFFSVAENLLLRAVRKNSSFQVVVSPYIELTHMSSAIQEINTLNTKIVFVSLNAERAIQLLCVVHERGLVWPEYAWIFHNLQVEHLQAQQLSCDDITDVVKGALFIDIQPQSDPMLAELISGITSSD